MAFTSEGRLAGGFPGGYVFVPGRAYQLMAASYIRIVIGILIGIAVLASAVGFGVGTKFKNDKAVAVGLLLFGIVVQVVLTGYVHRLGVSGPLINRQVIALGFEIMISLIGGGIVGILRRNGRAGAARIMLPAFGALIVGSIFFQIVNAQPVLDVLQQAGVLKPKDEYKPETNKTCPENLKGLYNAFEQYVELNDSLPAGVNWEDNTDLTSRIPQDEWLHCPVVSNGHDAHWGYAYNDTLADKKLNLNGKPLKTLPNAAKVPLLYDSTNMNKNAHDAGTSLPKPGRHGGRNNILYLDGHVDAVAP